MNFHFLIILLSQYVTTILTLFWMWCFVFSIIIYISIIIIYLFLNEEIRLCETAGQTRTHPDPHLQTLPGSWRTLWKVTGWDISRLDSSWSLHTFALQISDKKWFICYRIMWTLTTKEWWLQKQLQQLTPYFSHLFKTYLIMQQLCAI